MHTVGDVFAALNRISTVSDGRQQRAWGIAEAGLALVLIVTLAGAGIAVRVGLETLSLIFASAFLLAPLLYMLMTVTQALRLLIPILSAPTKYFFEQASKRVQQKDRAISELAEFPPDVRAAAEQALRVEVEGLEVRTTLLVGILEKTGFLPAAVALYLGYLQYLKNAVRSDWGDVLFLTASLLYVAAFFILAWKQILRERLWLLEQANA